MTTLPFQPPFSSRPPTASLADPPRHPTPSCLSCQLCAESAATRSCPEEAACYSAGAQATQGHKFVDSVQQWQPISTGPGSAKRSLVAREKPPAWPAGCTATAFIHGRASRCGAGFPPHSQVSGFCDPLSRVSAWACDVNVNLRCVNALCKELGAKNDGLKDLNHANTLVYVHVGP